MIPGIELTLGGKPYVVPPLSLPALRHLMPRMKAMRGFDDAGQKLVYDAAYLALKRNYPDITREDIEGKVIIEEGAEITSNAEGLIPDLETMGQVWDAVLDLSGVKRKEHEAGKQ